MPDILAETMGQSRPPGPPLSATSDLPDFKAPTPEKPASEPPAPAREAPKADKSAAVDEKGNSEDKSATAEKSAGENSDPDSKAKGDETPAWMKREITIERNKRRAAEERAKTLEEALRTTQQTAKPKEETPTPPTARPQRADFADPDAYEDALVDWASKRTAAETESKIRETEAKTRQQKEFETVAQTWTDRRAEFMADHPDFEEVAEGDNVTITPTMANAIWTSENGPAVAYYLGQNPEEAARIAKLDPLQAIKAIGKIEARLEAPAAEETPTPKPRKPDPIRPVGGSERAVRKSAAEESMEEYAARRIREQKLAIKP